MKMPLSSPIVTPQFRAIPKFSGGARDWVRQPHRMFLRLTQEYGDMVQYRAAPEPAFLLNHPDYIQQVLVANGRNYNKDTHLNKYMLESVVGQGLLTSENPLWRRQRHLIQPAFHRQNLTRFTDIMVSSTNHAIERLAVHAKRGEPFDIAEEMMRLTLDIVTRTLFGYEIEAQAEAVGRAVNTLVDIGKPSRPKFQTTLRELDEIVFAIINDRLARPNENEAEHDLLDMLLTARYEDTGERMSVQLARDEVMSLFIAGHETTANMLGWFWCMMGREPEAAALVADEVAQILDGRSPTAADLPHLVRVNQAVHETMRLYPPAWSISRRALGDDIIDGYFIPAGAVVALSPYTVHRHPDFWPDPERFDLERFTPEQEEARHRYAYIPFGGGARKCIGNQFALMESGIIISLIMQRFRFVLAADHLIEEHALITLRAKNGVMATAVSLS